MITKLTIKNFKSIKEETYSLTNFDLLVGSNNSGKSTVLQALAIWQFCVDEFHRAKRHGKTGIQIVLPNFTALPVPEFNLLWNQRKDRKYPQDDATGKKKQEYILIEIDVTWRSSTGSDETFGIKIRYYSPQAVFAIPSEGWKVFHEREKSLPKIAYVPPFSGLEPTEEWKDISILRKQVGKGQPGSILRNLLLLVENEDKKTNTQQWKEINSIVNNWFGIDLKQPKYEVGIDTQITCEYTENKHNYDIISGGSGFHQTLTLLAFLYGYKPTTILLDEPDAHLHVNLQREILEFFRKMSIEKDIQFLIATHAEELIKAVDANRIISLLHQKPNREASKTDILGAMSIVSNMEINKLRSSPYLLYVEGDTDERIIRAWAQTLGHESEIRKLCFHLMGGGNKKNMKENADRHFKAVQQIIPNIKRLMVFDYDTDENAFHPTKEDKALFEWERKNIENYLIVPDSWRNALRKVLGIKDEDSLFVLPLYQIINDFFAEQNLTLPRNKKWSDIDSDIFKQVDGKKILFDSEKSLFNKLRQKDDSISITRETVAGAMDKSEIHQDVLNLFDKIMSLTQK